MYQRLSGTLVPTRVTCLCVNLEFEVAVCGVFKEFGDGHRSVYPSIGEVLASTGFPCTFTTANFPSSEAAA